KPRPGRAPVYGPDLLPALITCPAVLRAPAGKLLAPMMPTLVPLLRRDKEADISDEQADLLMAMSAATIDCKLAGSARKCCREADRIPSPAACSNRRSRSAHGTNGTTRCPGSS